MAGAERGDRPLVGGARFVVSPIGGKNVAQHRQRAGHLGVSRPIHRFEHGDGAVSVGDRLFSFTLSQSNGGTRAERCGKLAIGGPFFEQRQGLFDGLNAPRRACRAARARVPLRSS